MCTDPDLKMQIYVDVREDVTGGFTNLRSRKMEIVRNYRDVTR